MAPSTVQENLDKVEEYKKKTIKQGEEIVRVKFPEYILEFTRLLEVEPFKCDDLTTLHSDLQIPVPKPHVQTIIDGSINNDTPAEGKSLKRKRCDTSEESDQTQLKSDVNGSKVYILPNGSVPINATITKMMEILKPLIRNLVEEVNVLKMWIAFLIPKIEDGNNFGVGIQEDTLEEIRSVESEASLFYEQMARYYLNRAKLVSKVAKYPHIDDYRRGVQELDEKKYLSLRITLSEIRNHYASLHDRINKNMDKIKKPRSLNNHESMY